jgi:sec-independent protein translocase protein TatC
MSKKSSSAGSAIPESFISHLIELRDRLLRSVIAVLIIFIPAAVFSGDLFTLLAKPMLSALSTNGTMISTEVAGPFLVPLKFAFALSVAIAIPFLLYQIWSFVAPGLYENEKKLAFPLLLSSTLLFYCGIAFAYFVVFPIMFNFFPSVAPTGIEVSPDINQYLGFVLKLFFAFGIAFEVPIATIIVIKAGLITPEKLASKRQYVVLGAFVIGMLLTPPDIFSQSMLALPMWLLFELGLIMSKMIGSRASADEDTEEDEAKEANEGDEASPTKQQKTTDGEHGDQEDDVLEPGIMPQQAGYIDGDENSSEENTSEDTGEEDNEEGDEEEEDLDKLAEELDQLEDISSWVQPDEDENDQSREDAKDQSSKDQGDQQKRNEKKPDESENGPGDEPDKKDS